MSGTEFRRGESKVALLIALLRRGSLTTSEAAEVLGHDPSNKRTARDALKRLVEIGPICTVGHGRDKRYVLDPVHHVQKLTDMDRIALRVGRDAVSFLEGTLLGEGLAKAAGEDGDVGGPVQELMHRVVHRPEPQPDYAAHRDTLDGVLDGLVRTRRLDFVYGRRQVEGFAPLTLVVYRRALYLLGRFDRDKVYRYRIDRMGDVRIGEPFTYPQDWDPDAELSPWFGMVNDGPIEPVVLEFSARVAPYIRERSWHPTARILDLPDGGVQLQMYTGGRELERFVLEWGEHCRVVSPASLRHRVMNALRAALAQYKDAGSDSEQVYSDA